MPADQPASIEAREIFAAEMAQFASAAAEAGYETCLEVAEKAKGLAPRESGAMAESCYATGGPNGESTYADAVGTAEDLYRGHYDQEFRHQPEEPVARGNIGARFGAPDQTFQQVAESVAACAADHGFFVENGYGPEGHRAPQPFFEPAAAEAEDIYLSKLEAKG